ncbi:SPOR domain-containing protein [Microbacteriaceae bacterium K1510]|nr:SPOR domain-containing protein [Microbacteriaceae bacterium K1510]
MAPTVVAPKRSLPITAAVRPPDRDAVWRLCGWGGSAVIAVAALAITVQSDLGRNRIDLLLSETPPAPTVVAEVPSQPSEPDPETLRLRAEVRNLIADRDRLAARFATLERHLDDVTSSVKQQATATPPAPPAPPPQVATVATTPPAAPTQVAAVTTTPALTIPTIDPLAMPGVTGSIGGWSPTAAAPTAEPAQAAKLDTRDVPAAPKPIAALPAEEPAPPAQTPGKAEYGIDLGSARDMDALRQRWSTIKANLGPLLTGLQPVAVRDHRPGKTDLRLVVGPMPNLAAARQVCTRFAASNVACHAAKFDGEAIVQR